MDIAWIGAGNGSGSNHQGSRGGAYYLKEQLSGNDFLDLTQMPILTERKAEFGLKALPSLVDFNQRLALKTESAHANQKFPVVVGGDHSCAIGTWSGIATSLQKSLGMLWIDAHLDAHTLETSESGNIHGMPLASLLGKGFPGFTHVGRPGRKLDPERTVVFGARCFEKGEAQLLKSMNVRIYLMDEILDRGFATCFREASDIVRGAGLPFGISLDLDALDPRQIPSVGTPVKGGLDAGEMLRALPALLGSADLQAFELVEYNPFQDKGDLGLTFIIEVMNLVQNCRRDLEDQKHPAARKHLNSFLGLR
jgi:arginase